MRDEDVRSGAVLPALLSQLASNESSATSPTIERSSDFERFARSHAQSQRSQGSATPYSCNACTELAKHVAVTLTWHVEHDATAQMQCNYAQDSLWASQIQRQRKGQQHSRNCLPQQQQKCARFPTNGSNFYTAQRHGKCFSNAHEVTPAVTDNSPPHTPPYANVALTHFDCMTKPTTRTPSGSARKPSNILECADVVDCCLARTCRATVQPEQQATRHAKSSWQISTKKNNKFVARACSLPACLCLF